MRPEHQREAQKGAAAEDDRGRDQAGSVLAGKQHFAPRRGKKPEVQGLVQHLAAEQIHENARGSRRRSPAADRRTGIFRQRRPVLLEVQQPGRAVGREPSVRELQPRVAAAVEVDEPAVGSALIHEPGARGVHHGGEDLAVPAHLDVEFAGVGLLVLASGAGVLQHERLHLDRPRPGRPGGIGPTRRCTICRCCRPETLPLNAFSGTFVRVARLAARRRACAVPGLSRRPGRRLRIRRFSRSGPRCRSGRVMFRRTNRASTAGSIACVVTLVVSPSWRGRACGFPTDRRSAGLPSRFSTSSTVSPVLVLSIRAGCGNALRCRAGPAGPSFDAVTEENHRREQAPDRTPRMPVSKGRRAAARFRR